LAKPITPITVDFLADELFLTDQTTVTSALYTDRLLVRGGGFPAAMVVDDDADFLKLHGSPDRPISVKMTKYCIFLPIKWKEYCF
jgi:hypothetical protein